jgi:hypothetical protein
MKFQSMFRNLGSGVTLALAFAIGSSIGSAQTSDSKEISNLMSQAKSHAALAEDDAAKLESYTRSNVSWQSHAARLQGIREHVNELGQLNKKLNAARPEGSLWQHMAVDEVDFRLREMADLLTATINYLNENPSRVRMPTFRGYVKANCKLTSRLAKMIDDYVDYDEVRSRTDLLEQKMNLPVVANSM